MAEHQSQQQTPTRLTWSITRVRNMTEKTENEQEKAAKAASSDDINVETLHPVIGFI